jgi:hypothetical protein
MAGRFVPNSMVCVTIPARPTLEFAAEKRQAVTSFDQGDALEPFTLECLDDSLGHGDGAVLSYRAEARFDVPLFQ